MFRFPLTILSLATLLPFAVAQDEPPMPKPTAEHKVLEKSVGSWDCSIDMMGPDGSTQQSKGTAVIRMGPGGFWAIDDTKAEMMGMPFTGHGVTGYDPNKKKYVMTWVDNFGPWMLQMEGDYDAKTNALTMVGKMPDGSTMKTVTRHKDADTNVFEMYMVADGAEQKTMTITYKRQKAGRTDGATGR